MRTDRAYTASDGPSFSIKIKIFAALIIIITTVIAVNALFIGHIIRKNKLESLNTSIIRQLGHIEDTFNLFVNDIDKTINTIAVYPAVKRADESIHSYIGENTAVSAKALRLLQAKYENLPKNRARTEKPSAIC